MKEKPFSRDQPPADPGPPGVVLGGAVRRLAQQDVAGVADPLQQRVQVVGPAERPGELPDLVAEAGEAGGSRRKSLARLAIAASSPGKGPEQDKSRGGPITKPGKFSAQNQGLR